MNNGKRLMTIGKITRSLGVTRRMILNYEERGLIVPDMKAGDTGNRYYTLDTLTRVRTIRVLQNMGLTLDEIRGYFDDSTDLKPMLKRLEDLRDELNLNIEKIRERIKPAGEADISYVTLPRQTTYRRSIHAVTVLERTNQLRDVGLAAVKYGTDTTRRMYFIEFRLDDPDLVSYCVAVPEGSRGEYIEEQPEVQALCIYHHGAYEELAAVREKLLAAAEERELEPLGICRHIYLEGPPQHKDPKRFVTQVALPVADRRKRV